MSGTTVEILGVIFLATFIRSAFGFGEALARSSAVGALCASEGRGAAGLLVSITIAAVVVAQDWRKIHVRSTGWLFFSTLAGIPLGLMSLTSQHQEAVKIALALVIS